VYGLYDNEDVPRSFFNLGALISVAAILNVQRV
jgi:hypothetical protein